MGLAPGIQYLLGNAGPFLTGRDSGYPVRHGFPNRKLWLRPHSFAPAKLLHLVLMKVNQGEIPATPFGMTFRIGNFGSGPAVSRPRNFYAMPRPARRALGAAPFYREAVYFSAPIPGNAGRSLPKEKPSAIERSLRVYSRSTAVWPPLCYFAPRSPMSLPQGLWRKPSRSHNA